MERYEINKYLETFKKKIADLSSALNVSNKREQIKVLDEQIASQDFWNDRNNATKVISEANKLKEDVTLYDDVYKKYQDLLELNDLSMIEEDALLLLEEEIINLNEDLIKAEEQALLAGEYDSSNVIVELHPGAGGTESMDWALMLYRMYQRFCQKKGFKFSTLDYIAGEEAGIKSVTFSIKGKNAYGLFKSERGVHRLVRISPFDSGARRHTSFCSCDVSPDIEENNKIDINPLDLRIDVYHSSGAGGQSVNTTDSAVRITHLPTNIVVTCQNERSQLKNKEVALKILKSKLLELQLEAQEEELNKLKGEQMGINFGSQIRSYVFCPYTLVKDHRTGYETNNVNQVMDGDIEGFMMAYLKFERGNSNE